MTIDEATSILKGDPSGLEFMTEEVYFVCKAFIDIMDNEGTDYGHHKKLTGQVLIYYCVKMMNIIQK